MYNENELKIINKLETKGLYLSKTEENNLTTYSEITVICKNGHVTKGIVKNLTRNSGCSLCKKIKSFYKLKSVLESYFYTVITQDFEYGGSNSYISYKCNKGHIQKQTVRSIRKGRKCFECYKYNTYDEVVKTFDTEGYSMLTTRDEYIDTKTKVKYMCNNGHIGYATVSDLSSGNRCMECCLIKKSERYRTPEELVIKEFHDNGYKVLNNNTDYKNGSTVYKTLCPNGHEYETSVVNFKVGGRCKKCANIKSSESRRRPLEDAIKIFKDSNYTIVDDNYIYENSYSIFKVKCPEGHIYTTSVANFNSGYRCNICSTPKGENHPQWKGGITPLHNRLREKINPWKQDSMKYGNNECFITGSKENKVIHHVYNFSKILQETLLELNYKVREKVNEYTDEELENIEKLCLKKHYEYGLGVVMRDDVHMLFHSVYGKSNNTMEQILEFKNDYTNGKYIINIH